ncbi:hypothetical protein FQA47_011587 [Oryzias melastigma]|uniref:Uncharacterized protein n=1 Tax=Oryzias melastigma TaxID=30732 RepID=A0A834FCC9_ORYME|nr:hypothetical protein FQA47_011587 [Oryzias melastigma]
MEGLNQTVRPTAAVSEAVGLGGSGLTGSGGLVLLGSERGTHGGQIIRTRLPQDPSLGSGPVLGSLQSWS